MRVISLVIISLLLSCNGKPVNEVSSKLKEVKPEFEIPKLKPKIVEATPTEKERFEYQKGHDLWYNDKAKEAISALTKFIQKYPTSSLADDAQSTIATSVDNLGYHEKAISEYLKVRESYPNSNSASHVLYSIAHIYFFEIKDLDKAKKYYEDFLKVATEDDKEIRDMAVEQLSNWEEKLKWQTGSTSVIETINFFKNLDAIRSRLSDVGIGQLGSWTDDQMGGYMSITPYYTFGSNNNLAYYLLGDNADYASQLKITLNINTYNERSEALSKLADIVEKTFEVLNISNPDGLIPAIKTGSTAKFDNEEYLVSFELEESKIESWTLTIKVKE